MKEFSNSVKSQVLFVNFYFDRKYCPVIVLETKNQIPTESIVTPTSTKKLKITLWYLLLELIVLLTSGPLT